MVPKMEKQGLQANPTFPKKQSFTYLFSLSQSMNKSNNFNSPCTKKVTVQIGVTL
jgi:hypothetical protein